MDEYLSKLLTYIKSIDFDTRLQDPANENILYLAYVGDTIFDFFTRDYLIRHYINVLKMDEIHKKNSDLVCAKSQARIVERLIDDKVLNNDEIDFYKHARNAHSNSKSKNSSIVDYRKATGFEALLGMLFYNDTNRLLELLKEIMQYIKLTLA